MTHKITLAVLVSLLLLSCSQSDQDADNGADEEKIIGAWLAKIQFQDGAFAEVHDLEFMYVFNDGGTMTESSNYDAIPPVPPAYGVWRNIGEKQYEVKYEFFTTRLPDSSDHVAEGAGWLPSGHGLLLDTILIASDGQTFSSKLHFSPFDQSGKLVEGGGSATGEGRRIKF